MDKDEETHAYMTGDQIENKEYYSAQTDIIKGIEKESRSREQTSKLGIEVFSKEPGIEGYLSSIGASKEKPSVPIVQKEDKTSKKEMTYLD